MGIGYYRWLNGVDFELVVQQIYIGNINGEQKCVVGSWFGKKISRFTGERWSIMFTVSEYNSVDHNN